MRLIKTKVQNRELIEMNGKRNTNIRCIGILIFHGARYHIQTFSIHGEPNWLLVFFTFFASSETQSSALSKALYVLQ